MWKKAVERTRQIPSWGLIKGGRLDGWRYHFLHVSARPDSLSLLARCTPPRWPFPRDIYLTELYFGSLRPEKIEKQPDTESGPRAKRIAIDPLIRSAYELEHLPVPRLLDNKDITLRALIKRVNDSHRNRRTRRV